jgi:hypothetical protein
VIAIKDFVIATNPTLASISGLFDTQGFPARWDCGTGWTPALGWTHIVADIAIFGAYAAIPASLMVFLARRRDIPFPGTGWLFVAFILSCGIGHLLEAVIFYQPIYRLSGLVKVVTAAVSWATVIALVRLMPHVLAVPAIKRENVELQSALGEKEREARSVERLRDQLEMQRAELAAQSRHIQSSMAAARAVSLNWEAETGRIVWCMGDRQPVLQAILGDRRLEHWDQLLAPGEIDRLIAAGRDGVRQSQRLHLVLALKPMERGLFIRLAAEAAGGAWESEQGSLMIGMFRVMEGEQG